MTDTRGATSCWTDTPIDQLWIQSSEHVRVKTPRARLAEPGAGLEV